MNIRLSLAKWLWPKVFEDAAKLEKGLACEASMRRTAELIRDNWQRAHEAREDQFSSLYSELHAAVPAKRQSELRSFLGWPEDFRKQEGGSLPEVGGLRFGALDKLPTQKQVRRIEVLLLSLAYATRTEAEAALDAAAHLLVLANTQVDIVVRRPLSVEKQPEGSMWRTTGRYGFAAPLVGQGLRTLECTSSYLEEYTDGSGPVPKDEP